MTVNIMSHVVDECRLTKFYGGHQALFTADEDSVTWLRKFGIHAIAISTSGFQRAQLPAWKAEVEIVTA